MVERVLAKDEVASSSLVFRSKPNVPGDRENSALGRGSSFGTHGSADCYYCGTTLTNHGSRDLGACATCRQALEHGKDPEREAARDRQRVATHTTVQVDDAPWRESGRAIFVVAYADLESLNVEAESASQAGYTIQSITAIDGHTNFGRTAVGFFAAGPLGAAIAHSRSDGALIVVWVQLV